jgi:hypothetical protein
MQVQEVVPNRTVFRPTRYRAFCAAECGSFWEIIENLGEVLDANPLVQLVVYSDEAWDGMQAGFRTI